MPQPFPNASTKGAVQPIGQALIQRKTFFGYFSLQGEARAAWESRSYPMPQLFAVQSVTADLGTLQ